MTEAGDEDVIRVEFQYTAEDFKAGKRAANPKWLRLGWWQWMLVVVGLLVLLTIYDTFFPGAQVAAPPAPVSATQPGNLLGQIVLSFLPYLLIVGVIWFFLLRPVLAKLRQHQKKQQSLHWNVMISENRIVWESENTRSENKWTLYCKHAESTTMFLLYTSPRVATMLPKRVLTDEQAERVRGILAAKVGKG